MLPSKKKKTTYAPVPRPFSFDKGKKLKPDKNKKKEDKKRRGAFIFVSIIMSLVLLLVVTTFASVWAVVRTKKFYSNLQNSVAQLDGGCEDYEASKPLNSLLFITLDSKNSLKNVDFVVYDGEKIIRTNFTNVEFYIDKGGTRGNIRKYIESNNIYLDDDKIFQNLSNLFLREFYLKVDHIIVSTDSFDFNAYLAKRGKSGLSKVIDATKSLPAKKIKTDVCKKTFDAFVDDFTSEKRSQKTVGYSDSFRIADYFYFGDMKKEQIRIHLNNATGVERWGNYFSKLFENYGLNVVKVDTAGQILPNSTIYIDDEKLSKSATIEQVIYLVDNLWDKPHLESKTSIFSDMYIDLGEDFLIK